MKLLLDQGLPRSAVPLLINAGIACEHVSEHDLSFSTDEEILLLARKRQAIIVGRRLPPTAGSYLGEFAIRNPNSH